MPSDEIATTAATHAGSFLGGLTAAAGVWKAWIRWGPPGKARSGTIKALEAKVADLEMSSAVREKERRKREQELSGEIQALAQKLDEVLSDKSFMALQGRKARIALLESRSDEKRSAALFERALTLLEVFEDIEASGQHARVKL